MEDLTQEELEALRKANQFQSDPDSFMIFRLIAEVERRRAADWIEQENKANV